MILSTSASVPQPSTPRWNIHKADWDTFRLLCQAKLRNDPHGITTNSLENFSATLLSIATENIPKTSNQQHRQSVPWFNDSCKATARKSSLQAFNKNPTNMNLSKLRVYQAKARRTIGQNKRNCWRSYVSNDQSNSHEKDLADD